MVSLKKKTSRYMLMLFTVALCCGSAAQATTIYVPRTVRTIQAAIDKALPGDVVAVSKGTYNERLDFKGRAITVRSGNPADPLVVAATIINGGKLGTVVTFKSGEKASSALRGFTLTNGAGTPDISGTRFGGAVYCYRSSPTLSNNVITANTADNGGGIYCFDTSSPALLNNTISSNVVTFVGGGLYCNRRSSPVVTGNLILNNTAPHGGGVYCFEASAPNLSGNTISGNTGLAGAGLYCYWASPSLTGNLITGNRATETGGGVNCFYYASPRLTNNTISGNSAVRGGGLFCQYGSSPAIMNSIIAFNGKGGGLCVDILEYPVDPNRPTVTYSDLYGNTGGNYVGWADLTGKTGNLSSDPLFANAAAGDFHEKSTGGRWEPNSKAWVADTVQSPCINKGNAVSPYALEPLPNGSRINMGAYGNTAQASKSPALIIIRGLQVTAAAAPAPGGGAQLSVNLSSAASVEVTITNLAGRSIATLPGRDLPSGVSTLLWSGQSATGLRVPAGSYLARLTARTADGALSQVLTTLTIQR